MEGAFPSVEKKNALKFFFKAILPVRLPRSLTNPFVKPEAIFSPITILEMKNLNLVLAVAAFFLFCTTTNAQLTFGVKAGLNLANVNFDGEEEADTKILPSFHAGAIVEFGITENIGIGSGLMVGSAWESRS